MNLEVVAYPFLIIAIYFESFVLVTFLSAPARFARGRSTPAGPLPTVAVIVPCFNEAATLAKTARSVLALRYPAEKLSLILVNDGSTDSTAEEMGQFRDHPQVTLIHQKNGGKHSALNAGIASTKAELVGCLDADSEVAAGALLEIVACFYKPNIAAATAAMSIHHARNPLQLMQHAEYILGITWRHVFASLNGLYVTPGPFSFYRRAIVEKLGGFRYGHQAEDMEMALRLQRAGYVIENAPKAQVYTKAPPTLVRLLKQRRRWTSGFLRNVLFDYRDLIGSTRNQTLGLLVLPLAVLSVFSGSILFVASVVSVVSRTLEALTLRAGMPASYAYVPHLASVDWFYVPTTLFTLLALVTVATSLAFIATGRHISKIKHRLVPSMASYVLLYGFVAPLWLIGAMVDVVVGKKRAWR